MCTARGGDSVNVIDAGLSQLDARASGRMGSRALLYYFTTTMIAVVIGIICVLSIKPGVHSVKGDLDDDEEKRIVKTVDAFLDLVRYFSSRSSRSVVIGLRP